MIRLKAFILIGLMTVMFMVINVWADFGDHWPSGNGSWVKIEELDSIQGRDELPIKVTGGVTTLELIYVGFTSIGDGTQERGYFLFPGEWYVECDPECQPVDIISWPPSELIDYFYVEWPDPRVFARTYYLGCGCSGGEAYADTFRLIDGFGFARGYDCGPPGFWPAYEAYCIYSRHSHPCWKTPCMSSIGGGEPKTLIVFTDSLYNELPDTIPIVISGDSPLYFKAKSLYSTDTLEARLYLTTLPDSARQVFLIHGQDDYWYGSYESGRALGLKSLNTAVIFLSVTYEDSSAFDQVDICLPKIITSTDTVEIGHADMRVSQDFIAGLEIVHDGTGNKADPTELVDSAGYQYKSYWVANCNLADTSLHRRYNRYYPKDSSSYLWWDRERDSCNVTFWKDSLYAVGGSLTVACEGYLSPIENINNKFSINTDNSINDSTSIATRVILIASDPPNNLFLDSLQYDIIKAIAYVEYAGSNDLSHCHHPYNPRYNNYWDHVINDGDTCIETRLPCENIASTATGTMQMLRTVWEPLFDLSGTFNEPDSFFACKWDSLAWNWEINIFNGKYVHQKSCFHHMSEEQLRWDSLYFPASDYTPDSTNQEDLATYCYKEGSRFMSKIITQKDWDENVKKHPYVNNVRKYKDTKPWEN